MSLPGPRTLRLVGTAQRCINRTNASLAVSICAGMYAARENGSAAPAGLRNSPLGSTNRLGYDDEQTCMSSWADGNRWLSLYEPSSQQEFPKSLIVQKISG
jgi:hypothetical protein